MSAKFLRYLNVRFGPWQQLLSPNVSPFLTLCLCLCLSLCLCPPLCTFSASLCCLPPYTAPPTCGLTDWQIVIQFDVTFCDRIVRISLNPAPPPVARRLSHMIMKSSRFSSPFTFICSTPLASPFLSSWVLFYSVFDGQFSKLSKTSRVLQKPLKLRAT